jgi:SAM-dependent methyltransferase
MRKPEESTAYRGKLYATYGTVFQGAPEQFDEPAARRWGRAYRHYLRGWLPTSKDASIADLACGYGRLLHFFREHGYCQITGVDISPDQIRRAREIVPAVHEANALDFLEAHPGEFDLITGLDLIEHLTKPEVLRFLSGCFTALKPGGRLILQTPNADSPFAMAIRYGDFTHELCLTPSALARLSIEAGFRAFNVRELGPVPFGYSIASSIRSCLWQAIRTAILITNVVETGSSGSGIVTRNFVFSAMREN